MLDGHKFMPRFPRTGKRIIQAKFEFLTKHGYASSSVAISGC
jgi:hypothetical protein